MGLAQTLFGFRGRIPRRTWWIWTLVLSVVMMGAFAAVLIHVGKDNFENIVAFDLVEPQLAACFSRFRPSSAGSASHSAPSACTIATFSGFWVVIPALITIAIIVLQNTGHGGTFEHPSIPVHVLTLASMGFNLWLLVQCGFLKGTQGPNRFGPDPLAV